MQRKSWAFTYRGHAFRTEIEWHLFFRATKVLYIDHQFVRREMERFNCHRPLVAEVKVDGEPALPVSIHFRPRWFFFGMGCDADVGRDRVEWSSPDVQIHKESEFRELGHLGCAIIFPVTIILAVLLGPIMIIGVPIKRMQERARIIKIRMRGRVIAWSEVERRMMSQSSPSTLILQLNPDVPRRAWWTPDDLTTRSPLKTPADNEVAFFPRSREHPFFDWVWHWYLSEETGTAMLCDVPESVLARLNEKRHGFNLGCLSSLYPSLRVVLTSCPSRSRFALVPDFCTLLNEDPALALTKLKAGQPKLRKMFLGAISLMNRPPISCADGLRQALYLGPDGERFAVVEALGVLGPVGDAILDEAALCQDPLIRKPAIGQRHRAADRAKELERKDRIAVDKSDK